MRIKHECRLDNQQRMLDYLEQFYVYIPERGGLGPYTAPANGKAPTVPNVAPRG